MQDDGNLVLYDEIGSAPVWHSGTWGNPGAYLNIGNNGSMTIQTPGGQTLTTIYPGN